MTRYTFELFKEHNAHNRKVLRGCGHIENKSFQIAWDGKVRLCCDVVNEDFVIGNLNHKGF